MTHSASPGDAPADVGPVGARPVVSLVVVNARIWTGRPGRPWADAVAVRGDRLAAVGSSAEIRKLAGAAARVVDAHGRLVVAGGAPGGDVVGRDDASLDGGVGKSRGRVLAAGAPADFVVLDCLPSGTPPVPPPDATVVLMVAGGAVVIDVEV